jgi:hypothetical protein
MCVYILFFSTQKAKTPYCCTHSDFLGLVILKVPFSANFTEVTGKLHTSEGLIMKKELS